MLLAWLPYVASLAALCCQPSCPSPSTSWSSLLVDSILYILIRIAMSSILVQTYFACCFIQTHAITFFATSLLWKNVWFHCPVCHHIPECFTSRRDACLWLGEDLYLPLQSRPPGAASISIAVWYSERLFWKNNKLPLDYDRQAPGAPR